MEDEKKKGLMHLGVLLGIIIATIYVFRARKII